MPESELAATLLSNQLGGSEFMEFKDISTEKLRTYVFAGGEVVVITAPLKLSVSASGGHRIVDASGTSHYIPPQWHHLYFVVKEGAPAFSF